MKKIFVALLVVMLLGSCTSTPKAPDDLDMAIRDASDYLNDNLPARTKIVILNIQSDSNALSDYIIDELIANAVNDRNFTVVDRQQLELIRTEQNFQWSGEVDDRTALEVGRFFGAQYIVSGRVTQLDDRYRMNIRALNVQTAQVQGQYNRNISAGRTILALIRSGRSGSGGTSYGTRTAGGSSVGGSRQTQVRLENGVYTFYPRLTATKAGLRVTNVFVPQVTVAGGYITIHFARSATGAWDDSPTWGYGPSGFYAQRNFTLQDLDNPSRFYNPVSARNTDNGMGNIWSVSFRQINSKRFKLTFKLYDSDDPPYVIDEIVLGEPD